MIGEPTAGDGSKEGRTDEEPGPVRLEGEEGNWARSFKITQEEGKKGSPLGHRRSGGTQSSDPVHVLSSDSHLKSYVPGF